MSSALRDNLINQHGESARQWLAVMPKRLNTLCAHYQLSESSLLEPLTWHVVTTAIDSLGQAKVLKLGMDNDSLKREGLALSAFAGKGAIQLLASGEGHLLLEYASPGQPLKSSLSVEEILEIYPPLIDALHHVPSGEFPHLADWLTALDRITDNRVEPELITLGLYLRDNYLRTLECPVLCHGDLHANNIILSERGWLAIDPKGVIADKAFELSALELFDTVMSEQQLIGTLESIASMSKLPVQRLTQAFYLRALLSAAWFIEDGGSPSPRLNQCRQLRQIIS